MQPNDVIEAQNPVYTFGSKLMMKNNVNRPWNIRDLKVSEARIEEGLEQEKDTGKKWKNPPK